MFRRITLSIVSLLMLIWMVCATAAPIQVFVSVLPLKYFVKQVGGNHVKVAVMVGPGQSPETYAPTPRQMQQLNKTEIYYRVGVPFERAWMHKIKNINSKMQLIDLRRNIKVEYLGKAVDPHIWTDPVLVMHMAKTIRDSLIKLDPADKEAYDKNYVNFIADLEKLDQKIRAKFADLHNHTFMVFHPAWGYFAARYGLKQIAIAKEGKPIGPRDLERVINTARAKHVRLVLVQPQFSNTQANMIAHLIHAKVVTADPLAENYLVNMNKVVNIFVKYLGKQ